MTQVCAVFRSPCSTQVSRFAAVLYLKWKINKQIDKKTLKILLSSAHNVSNFRNIFKKSDWI